MPPKFKIELESREVGYPLVRLFVDDVPLALIQNVRAQLGAGQPPAVQIQLLPWDLAAAPQIQEACQRTREALEVFAPWISLEPAPEQPQDTVEEEPDPRPPQRTLWELLQDD